MAAVDREIQITYGTFVVGGTTTGADRLIHGFIQIDKAATTLSVSFDFVISKVSEADFQAEVVAVEDAFRNPYQDLLVQQGGQTLIDCRPSTNSGLNTQPSIVKGADEAFDTGRSRKYTVSISAELPADLAPTAGVRDSSVNVAFSPARRRTVTISGTVTALASLEARAEYTSVIANFCAVILSALGGTYELGEEPTTESDYEDKTLQFSRVFDELIFEQAPGETDNLNIVRQSFKVTRSQIGPGDTSGTERLVNLSASYEAWIDAEQTTDVRGQWDVIKPWVYEEMKTALDAGSMAVTDASPTFDYDDNKITVSITAVGSTGSSIIEHKETTQMADVFGVVFVPAWEEPYSKYTYQGPASRRRTTTTIKRSLGGGGGKSGGGGGGGLGLQGGGGLGGGIGQDFLINRPGKGGFSFGLGGPAAVMGGGGIGMFLNRGGGGGGGGGTSSTGEASSISDLLGTDLSFIPISLTDSQTPLVLGTDGETLNVVDSTTVMVEEGFVEVANKGGGAGTGTGPPQAVTPDFAG